tara:strand:- start:6 stop:431 length:426 start_codon:yes stop_codon:yes gene_type:complete
VVSERRLSDTRSLIRVLRVGFPMWYRRLPYLFYRTIVARVDGEVVGFVSMPMRAGVGEIGLIAVAEAARGSGVGATLLSAALRCMERSGMHTCVAKVRVDNPGGQALFSRLGFETVGVDSRMWLGDVDRVRRPLSKSGRSA